MEKETDRLTAIKNWPEYGDYVFNRSDIFHPYWLQFQQPEKHTFYAFATFVTIVGLLSILGNGTVCYTFLRSPSLRKQKMFIINLCLSDFLSPLLTYHMFVYSSIKGLWQFSHQMCNYYAICQGFCGLMSIASLAAIAFERYARMVHPRSKWAHMTGMNRLAVIAFLWIYCALVTTPPLYGIGRYVSAGFLNTCCFDYIDRDPRTRCFVLGLFLLGLGVPMAVIIYSYIRIGMNAVKRPARKDTEHQLQQLSSFSGLSGDRRYSPTMTMEQVLVIARELSQSMQKRMTRRAELRAYVSKELKVARLTLLIISVFVAAWVPYGTVALLGQFGPKGAVTPWMAMLPSICAKSSTLYNPFLYAYKDLRLQRALRKYVLRHSSIDSQPTATLLNVRN